MLTFIGVALILLGFGAWLAAGLMKRSQPMRDDEMHREDS